MSSRALRKLQKARETSKAEVPRPDQEESSSDEDDMPARNKASGFAALSNFEDEDDDEASDVEEEDQGTQALGRERSVLHVLARCLRGLFDFTILG